MTAMHLLAGPFLPAREADFQALWYYGILALAMAILIAAACYYALRSVGSLWREGEQPTAALIVTVTGFTILMMVAIAVVAVVGLTNNPGTGPG